MILFKISPARGFRHGLLQLSIAAALMLLAAHALAIECEKAHRLRFAMVPQDDLQKDIAAHQPLFDLLHAATGLPVEVVMPSSYGAVVEGLLAGAIDLANLGPAVYINAKKSDPRITAFAATAKKKGAFQEEGAFYASLLIVRQQGPYTSLETLRGKRLALVDPDSTSGALIPRQAFSRHVQASLGAYFSQIGYTGSHDQSALAVANGRVDAAFVSSYLLASLVDTGKVSAGDFRVLWRSARMPLNPYVYRGQLCAGLKEKISAVFFRTEWRRQQGLAGQSEGAALRADQRQRLSDIARLALIAGGRAGFRFAIGGHQPAERDQGSLGAFIDRMAIVDPQAVGKAALRRKHRAGRHADAEGQGVAVNLERVDFFRQFKP